MTEQNRPAILVVDDYRMWRETLASILDEEYEVTQAQSFAEALDKVLTRAEPFHVCIADVRLTDTDPENEDGLRLVRTMNELGQQTNTIVVTGYPTIDTAKRALKALSAYDYILKSPEDGSDFSIAEFRKVVQRAVEDAERKRPAPFVADENCVLVAEPDSTWLERLVNLLQKDGYSVQSATSVLDLERKLKIGSYSLIVLNSVFLSQSPDILYVIAESGPSARVIILTTSEWADMARAVRNQEVLNVIQLSGRGFDSQFRSAVKQAFMGIPKYVLAGFEEDNGPAPLQVGESYVLRLMLQDVPGSDAIAVALTPVNISRGFTLRVSVYAPRMKVQPGEEIAWEFGGRAGSAPLRIEFIPKIPGNQSILLDLYLGEVWVGRLEKSVVVVSSD